jgi:phage-related protein
LYILWDVDRDLLWVGCSRSDIKAFPAAARRQAGYQLQRVQQGLDPSDWKPMRTVGVGVREIRIHVGTAHRVFYLARLGEAVYVLHAFQKRSRKTAKRDLEIGRERYRDLVARRRKEGADAKR